MPERLTPESIEPIREGALVRLKADASESLIRALSPQVVPGRLYQVERVEKEDDGNHVVFIRPHDEELAKNRDRSSAELQPDGSWPLSINHLEPAAH
jgi:hypothetical protein